MDLGIFIFSSHKKADRKYIRLPDTEMMQLAEKNINSIKNYIIKHDYGTSFFYHSTKEVNNIAIPASYQCAKKSLYHKPQGLWISCGTSWLDYVMEDIKCPHKWNLFSYTYKIDLFDNVKIISEKEELHKFIKKYKKKPDDIRLYDIMDWNKVKEDYAGLVITPHLGNKIWRSSSDEMCISGAESAHDFFVDLLGAKWKNNVLLLCEWYRSWVASSGVIWNASGIASFKLIKRTNYKKYLL
jgi:hypothetical protein